MIDKSVTIIGTGALGSSLAKVFDEKGIIVYSLFNRSAESLEKLNEKINPAYSGRFPENFDQLGDIIFITTSDQNIKNVADELAELNDEYPNKIVVHCSGTESSAVLASLKNKGASTASFHPNQTFTKQSKPSDLKNIYFDIEGDERAAALLKQIAEKLGAHYFEVSQHAKPYLHAAGVMSSNYLFALLRLSADIAEMGGLERQNVIKAMLPLASKTIENARAAKQMSEAISGPIARGDDKTVAKHLELLRKDSKIYHLYRELGEETLKLAKQGRQLSDDELKQLGDLLKTGC